MTEHNSRSLSELTASLAELRSDPKFVGAMMKCKQLSSMTLSQLCELHKELDHYCAMWSETFEDLEELFADEPSLVYARYSTSAMILAGLYAGTQSVLYAIKSHRNRYYG